jgi:CheY-like chemotaxis protein
VPPANIGPRRILVVDDNQDQAQSLAPLLKLIGHEVHIAFDEDALQAAIADHPDMALIDIGLPAMNGYELARRIRARPQLANMVLVAQTGWGQDEDRRRSKEAGFDVHLVKPVMPDTLKEILRILPKKQK